MLTKLLQDAECKRHHRRRQ